MRVAYVCADPGVPVFGRKGCSVHVQEVIRALIRRGDDVQLLAMNIGGERAADLADLRVQALPSVGKTADVAKRERAALAANELLRARLERLGDFDFVYERYSLWSFAGMEYARHRGVPGLLEVNAPLLQEQARYRTVCDRAAAEEVARRAFSSAAALLTVSEEIAGWLREQHGVSTDCVHVIPNAVDVRRFRPGLVPGRPASSPDAFTVGFVGTMRPWHGVDLLVGAFALLEQRVPGSRLLAVGDGPARAAAEEALVRQGLRHAAEFTGAVAPEEVPALLASMDVAVAPYPALAEFYFSPLKLYEYMAMGLPVVASRIGTIARTVQDGVTGLLCEPGDSRELADALIRLAGDPPLRARLGQAARQAIVVEHTWDNVAQRIAALAAMLSGTSRQASVAL